MSRTSFRFLCHAGLVLLLYQAFPAQAAAPCLLAFGDSLTAGYGLPADQGFVPRLEAALKAKGADVRVVNAGVSGDTTAGGLARLAWTLHANCAAVLVELGANDMLRGLPAKEAERNLDEILTVLGEKRLPVLLIGMKAQANLGLDYAREFDGLYARLARKHKVALYPFFLEGVALKPALNQDDGLHPNASGVLEIVRRILPDVLDLMKRAKGGKG
jgi:acyl-CoA thioesterase-1